MILEWFAVAITNESFLSSNSDCKSTRLMPNSQSFLKIIFYFQVKIKFHKILRFVSI
jgi:hypothetical protein